MADTRKDRRAPVSLKVRFKSATVDEFIEHYCKDVSRGGIFIKSSQPMSIGTLLKFQFQLKDESSLIRGVGRVVWTRSPEDAVADQPAGMGIKFIKMDNESRAMVERIVEGHGDEPGAYDEGRVSASENEGSSEPPVAPSEGGGGGFFPQMEPAELPPPEDRTAVRQAAQFLAAALAEGGTDQAAAREAEQKAAEARARTAQIEAERLERAERERRTFGTEPITAVLPSMIIDPSLSNAEEHDENDDATVVATAPVLDIPNSTLPPPATSQPQATPSQPAPASSIPSVTPTAITAHRPKADSAPPAAGAPSLPPPSMPPPAANKKSPLIPATILAGIVAIAAFVATRDKQPEVEPTGTVEEAPAEQPSTAQPAAEPTPEPAQPAQPEPEQTAEPAAAAEQASADAQVAAAAQPMVELAVRTVPANALVSVGGVEQGPAPLSVNLPEGVPTIVSARADGHVTLSQEVTAQAGDKKPLRLVLPPLSYVVHVSTQPEGAQITIGAKRGTSPVELDLGPNFKGALAVTAKLSGYQSARQPLEAKDFTAQPERMAASVSLTLAPAPAAKPVAPKPAAAKPAPKPADASGDEAEPAERREPSPEPAAEPAPEQAPAAAPPASEKPSAAPAPEKPAPEKPASEKPAPEKPAPEKPASDKPASPDKPADQLPDNPFG